MNFKIYYWSIIVFTRNFNISLENHHKSMILAPHQPIWQPGDIFVTLQTKRALIHQLLGSERLAQKMSIQMKTAESL